MGLSIVPYNSSEKPDRQPNKWNTFTNKRAQAFWELREDLQNCEIELFNDKDLINELTSINYDVNNKVIKIEDKQAYKARNNKSPDLLDAAVIANYVRKRAILSYSSVFEDLTDIPDTMVSEISNI